MLGSDIGYLHHVGHVVRDMQQARDLYQKLGFACPAPAYPTLARHADQPATPFGAANTHATFGRNFVELLTLVTDRSRIPEDARPVPLHVPPAALPGVVASIERTLAQVSASLARLEGLHIVVFQTEDADASVRRFDLVGVGHGDAYTVQRPGDSGTGQTTIPVRLVEIDAEDAPEGRLAVAENPSTAAHPVRPDLQHPNGAVDLIEAMLCVADAEIDRYVQRYQRYLGRPGRNVGPTRVFALQHACVRIVPVSALGAILPGQSAACLPAFAAYAVAVHDLAATRTLLEGNGLPVCEASDQSIFVPASAALGASVIFRQAH